MLQKEVGHSMFPNLFTPCHIGKLRIKNRLVKAPLATRFADSRGFVTERLISHYREIAKGGAGLVIVEFAHVDGKASQAIDCQLDLSRDEALSGLDWLAATIKDYGARACQQIAHTGMFRLHGRPPVKAPSSVTWPAYMLMPAAEELTREEIKEIVEAFGDAALRVKKTGFDMVEVHGAHDYLITNFLSPHYNRRSDSYGGNLTNRMRFLLEILNDIREKIGNDFPISVRLSGTDYAEENPITIDETKEVAKVLEKAGVNVIHVSYGGHIGIGREKSTMYSPRGGNVWLAEEVKKAVNIPVIAVGSVTTPELAEKIVAEKKADFVALGRPLLADPYYPLKAKEGRPEDICTCIRCSDGCYDRGVNIGSVKCSVNPTLGREAEFKITPVSKLKKVAVVGGGPAGMEAARVAALRGHKVTLFERKALGGMLVPASVPEFKADLRIFVKYLCTQVEKAGVQFVKSEATSQTIRDGEFDAVIVANGATPWLPDVAGIDQPSVVGALDALSGAELGEHVIVVGGGVIGSDVALFVAEQGKKVTITTRGNEIARGLSRRARGAFLERLHRQGVSVRTGVQLEEVTHRGIVVSDRDGRKNEIIGDNVIIASGLMANRQLYDDLVRLPDLNEVYAVGDCVEPRTVLEAIHEGYTAAFNL